MKFDGADGAKTETSCFVLSESVIETTSSRTNYKLPLENDKPVSRNNTRDVVATRASLGSIPPPLNHTLRN
jgi:hypothetical protein